MKRIVRWLLVVMIALSTLQGCSTIIYGSRQDLKIDTEPPGASARVGTQSCVTPCTLDVSRKQRYIFIGNGKTERAYRLTRTRNNFTFFIGNLLFGFPGLIVDASSGARISLDDVNITTNEKARADAQTPSARNSGNGGRNVLIFVDYNKQIHANMDSIKMMVSILGERLQNQLRDAGYAVVPVMNASELRSAGNRCVLRVELEDFRSGPIKTIYVHYEFSGDGRSPLVSDMDLSTAKGSSKLARVVAKQLAVIVEQRLQAE